MRRSVQVATAVAGLALLAACANTTDDPPAGPTEGTSAPVTEAPTDEPTTTSPTDDDDGPVAAPAEETNEPAEDVTYSTEPQNDPDWPGSGGDLLPTGVRVGAHEGYERVVFDFQGSETPGWRVEYVDAAIEEGRGQEVDLDGDAILQVIATGVRYPEEAETDLLAQGSFDTEQTDLVDEVFVTGIFEGQNQAFIGLDEQVPFRVFTLTDPSRLVVDLQLGES
ncbi:AMIN-like domain-containing (lipo)protein [Georgenia subflava]|uniref:AMIN-like domain-containing protein n=1 Tax=Georgenia subflava TaxID=1622177 RepID=A0A6N7EHR7_9MICO|nr:hypothetical protein [Georgenia subflava]MPV36257.1 hypothetical protein [Georgenia subflava]